jgi:methionyl aminopeptidase
MGRVILKTPGELDLIHEANVLVMEVLDGVEKMIEPGITTRELDRWTEDYIRQRRGVPAFKNYRGFPASLCVAPNDVIVHGFPDERPLQNGDIVGVDCGVMFKGYFGDAARTFRVGKVAAEADRLLRVTYQALELACRQMVSDRHLGDVGFAVQRHVENNGFSVVRQFVGHGVGTSLHEEPQVANFGKPGKGMKLRPGMVLAIEPMVNAGVEAVSMDADGWTARTKDGKLSAHFEYSVAVTENGPRVLGVTAAQNAEILAARSLEAAAA